MDRQKLRNFFDEKGAEVKVISFDEDGYEVVVGMREECLSANLDEISFEGYVVSYSTRKDSTYTYLFVPSSKYEMHFYVLEYIKRFCNLKEVRMTTAMGEALCALEKAIENLADSPEKIVAIEKYNVYADQILGQM